MVETHYDIYFLKNKSEIKLNMQVQFENSVIIETKLYGKYDELCIS